MRSAVGNAFVHATGRLDTVVDLTAVHRARIIVVATRRVWNAAAAHAFAAALGACRARDAIVALGADLIGISNALRCAVCIGFANLALGTFVLDARIVAIRNRVV